jgi:hypothetical protein
MASWIFRWTGVLFTWFLCGSQGFALTCGGGQSGLSASAFRDQDQVIFRVSAGRGYESLPQVQGPLSAQDMAMARFQIESLKPLGTYFEISMPADKCDLRRSAEGIFSCSARVKIPGTNLEASSLNGYREKQSHTSGDFEVQNFRMMIGDVNVFFVNIPFARDYCSGVL